MARKRIGDLLVGQGVVTLSQLEQALGAQKGTSRRLGETLVELGFLDEDQLASALADALQLPRVDLSQVTPDWGAVHLVPAQACESRSLFPFGFGAEDGKRILLLAMSDPSDAQAIQELETTTGMKVSPRVASLSGIQEAVKRYHHRAAGEPPRRPPPGIPLTTPVGVRRPAAPSPGQAPPPGIPLTTPVHARRPAASAEPTPPAAPVRRGSVAEDLDFLFGNEPVKGDPAERLETLVRLLIRKGLLTEAEWLEALRTR